MEEVEEVEGELLTCEITAADGGKADMLGRRQTSSVAGESLGPHQSVSGLVCYQLQSADSSPSLSLVLASITDLPLVEAGC